MMASPVSPYPLSAPMSPSYLQQQQQQHPQLQGSNARPFIPVNRVLQSSVESLNLIRAEIRCIGFIDLVHNLFAFFFLFYYLIIVGLAAALVRRIEGSYAEVSIYQYRTGNLVAVIIAILIAIPMVLIGLWTAVKLRGATNETTCFAAMEALHPYFILNVLLFLYGFACNIALFAIYPYPTYPWGMYLLFSNCLRWICLCVVRNYQSHMERNNYNNLLSGPRAPPKLATPIQPANLSNSPV